MDAKRHVVIGAAFILLAAMFVAGCIPDKLKPGGWWWEGPPYPASILSLKAPDAVSIQGSATVRAIVMMGGKTKVVEESVKVVEATRTVQIRLILRAYGDYLVSSAMPPPPIEKRYTVSFPTPGEWTIRFEGEAGTEAFTTTVTVLPAEEV